MIKKIGAKYVITGHGPILEDYAVILNDFNVVEKLVPLSDLDQSDVHIFPGYIMPGFVNTHCHLELSHMKNLISTGTGLIPFIRDVVTKRAADPERIQEAMDQADRSMWENGIMAVGDISNVSDSAVTKKNSKLDYYTFIESFDLMQADDTDRAFNESKEVLSAFDEKKSIVPHAPYSCSQALLNKINDVNQGMHQTISIHNQETVHENNFFINKTGQLVDFYKSFGLKTDNFDAINKTSIHYLLNHIDPDQQYLFVHNTLTNQQDFEAAEQRLNNIFWSTCPNANLYIENALPDYKMFMENNAKMTIGTDSLASNWQLSIWDEMTTIKKFNSYLPNELLIQWATINGAKALQMDDKLGSIEVGKCPGLLHLDSEDAFADIIHSGVRPKRIV